MEQYIFQQAELARQRAKLPGKNKRNLSGKEKGESSLCKRQKVVTNSQWKPSLKRSKHREPTVPTTNRDLQKLPVTETANKVTTRGNRVSVKEDNPERLLANGSSVIAQSEDVEAANSSNNSKEDSDCGSEYLPSDEQPDSGIKNEFLSLN